jgi:lipoprotein-anchoring transpeptidase ErfK/SrfK
MKRISQVLLSALLASVPLAAAQAGDRYGELPPVVLSPDLMAPWLMQLGVRPTVAPDGTVSLEQQLPARPARTPSLFRTRTTLPPAPARSLDYYPPAPSADAAAQKPVQMAALVRPSRQATALGLDPEFLPQEVAYDGPEKPGTIIIDTGHKFLYHVEADGKAMRYGVGVGRPGFEWAGAHYVTRKSEWPEWRPPSEMIAREAANGHIIPAMMPGGPDNPLGARALYLGSTLYRIHGTNQPWTIGKAVSSGCIRMRNEDVIELYDHVKVGTKVVVM